MPRNNIQYPDRRSSADCSFYEPDSALQTVLCETGELRHFIYAVPNGIFSLWVDRNSQKLGLMRLLMKHYIDEIRRVLSSVSLTKPAIPDDLRELLLSEAPKKKFVLARRDQ